ncbi:MAG: YbdK family carboxylate-amine ligase, partial [Gemmatimonadota bacterium]|nr:YbdK family carboxylate-amine ligase [Gemmatimonadota bacterium]
WEGQEFTDREVYLNIRREYRQLAEEQNIFGMHVHVGVPEEVDRARLMNVARLYLPHLLALSASSPFYLGRDTGYASFRAILWRRWPRAGAPPRFESQAELDELIRWLTETRCIDAPGRLYWELRPHHRYPTLEFRVCDVTPRLEDAVATAALARAVVVGAAEGVLRDPGLPDSLVGSLLRENAWRASRDGVGALLVDVASGVPREVSARDALRGLAESLALVLERLEDGEITASLEELLERGEAASRMRAQAERAGGELTGVVRWLAEETVLGTGMDRRTEQREGSAG